jgi:hypothetical protein
MNPDTLTSVLIVDICRFVVCVNLLLNLPSSRDTYTGIFQLGATASTKPQNKVDNSPPGYIII